MKCAVKKAAPFCNLGNLSTDFFFAEIFILFVMVFLLNKNFYLIKFMQI